MYTCLKWFIGAAAIHFFPKLFRQTANLNIVVVCYTLIVIYAPLFSLLESPGLYSQLLIVSQLRAQQLEFAETIKFLFAHASELKPSDFQVALTTILQQIEGAIFIILSVFVAESLAALLLNDKFKTYLAQWLSSIVSFFPIAILNAIWVAVEWRHAINKLEIPN